MKWLTAGLLTVAAGLGGLLLARQSGTGAAGNLGGTPVDPPLTLPALPLTDADGQETTLAAGDGRLRLVFFGFVRCPDVCPATLGVLKNAYTGLSPQEQAKVRVQLVSVDPEYDRPNVLRDYLDRFDPAFDGLTGTRANIDAAAKALFVSQIEPQATQTDHSAHMGGGHAPKAEVDPSTRQHGDEVRVVNPAGQFVRVYLQDQVIDGTLGRDLPGLIRTYGG